MLHRMLNIVQPMSYIQPHRHTAPPKVESFIVLKGALLFFIFSNNGDIVECHHLTANASKIGIDVEPGIYHSFAETVEDAVLFEVKQGPYQEIFDKDFAPWAPVEGSAEAIDCLKGLYGNG